MQAHTMTIYNEAKTSREMVPDWDYDWFPGDFGIALRSIFKMMHNTMPSPPFRQIIMTGAGHFPICFGLGVYGHRLCLHSLQETPRLRKVLTQSQIDRYKELFFKGSDCIQI